MTAIDRLHQAEAAAREATEKWAKALAKHQVLGGYPLEVTAAAELCAETQRDLLAALDAARGEAVWQVSLPKNPECWTDYGSETTANAVAKASGNKCIEVRAVFLAPPAALAVPADAMVERALKVLAFEHDGALFPDDYSDEEADAERETMRKVLAAALAANKENNNG